MFSSITKFLDEFHAALGEIEGEFTLEQVAQRRRLIKEEYKEVMEVFDEIETGDFSLSTMAHLAKELADLEYVVRGGARLFGFPQDAVVAEVHRSNMTKFVGGPTYRKDGKLLKGRDFEEADITGVLWDSGWLIMPRKIAKR